MANVAYEKGFIRAHLTHDHAATIWEVMQKADCTPAQALSWLLDVGRAELGTGVWNGSTASQIDVQGLKIFETNLDRLVPFRAGDMVLVNHPTKHDGQPIVGTVHSIDSDRAQLRLTSGSLERMRVMDPCAEYNYVCPTKWLSEL